jgi:hypothetical protein
MVNNRIEKEEKENKMNEQPICSVCKQKIWKSLTAYDNQGQIEVEIADVCDCNPIVLNGIQWR